MVERIIGRDSEEGIGANGLGETFEIKDWK
jgi:hypothetical protein